MLAGLVSLADLLSIALTDAFVALPAWSAVPLQLLHAELQRRQAAGEKPECGTKGRRGAYNTSLHVFALILILVLSTLGTTFHVSYPLC